MKKRIHKIFELWSSIRHQVQIWLTISLLLYTFVIIAFVYIRVENKLIDEKEKIIALEITNHIHEISETSTNVLDTLRTSQNVLNNVDLTKENELDFLKTTMALDESYENGVYIGESDENLIIPSGWVPDSDFLVTNRDWYLEGLNNDSPQFGDVYIDQQTGGYVVTASVNLKPNNGVKRVAAIDVYLSGISEKVAEMSDERLSVLMLNSKNNEILAFKDSSEISQIMNEDHDSLLFAEMTKFISANKNFLANSLDNISSASISGNDEKGAYGVSDVIKVGSDEYYVNMSSITDTDWMLVSYANLNIISREINSMLGSIVIIAAVGVLLTIALIVFVVSKLLSPLETLTKGIENMTSGDFTKDFDVVGKNEISQVALSLNTFIDTMRGTVKKLNTISEDLLLSSTNTNDQSRDLMDTSEMQAASMEELNATVDEMARASTDIAENVTSLAGIVTDTHKLGELINTSMGETVDVSQKGIQDMERLNLSISEVEDSVVSLKDAVVEVDSQANKIVEIINMIDDIANQTNLLSLNASIEASRAGEAGAGFAIVATEIRKLAEQSKKAADEIAEIINNMTDVAKNTTSRTEATIQSVADGRNVITVTEETFKNIFEKIYSTNAYAERISKNIENVNDIASSVAAITEEQSAANQEISATAETLATGAENILQNSLSVGDASEDLNKISKEIKDEIGKFKA